MQLCSLSVACACPYQNPTSTMGHCSQCWHQQATWCHTRCLPSALYNWNRDSSLKITLLQRASGHWKVSICPLKSVTTPNCSQVKTLVRTTSTQMSFPKTVSDSLCGNLLVVQTPSFISCPGDWCQTIPQVRKPDVEVLGWRGYTWSAVVWPVGCTAKCSKTILEAIYGTEMYIKVSGNSSGGHSSSQHANCTLPQNLRHLRDKTANFRVAFYCPQQKVHLCNDHAV